MIGPYELTVLALASGRVAYSITMDDIFDPVRVAVWRRSAPAHAKNDQGQAWRQIESFKSTPEELERWPGIGRWQEDFDGEGSREPGFFGKLFECFYCMSFWTSLAAIVAYWLAGDAAVTAALPFALWGAANIVASKGLA